ncbi:MAG TPA: shikimate dehydrogenase [Longimicrobiales bacterium]|nr:shikimate dehydrogenase [Longimicrobiales bacterium]
MPEITAATRLVALLGDPVAHSLSPRIQNAAFRAAGVDGVYVGLRCDAEHAPALLRAIARSGGAGNVTVPHKQLAARTIEAPTPAVERTGACNTFWLEDGRIHGDNTDVAGFVAAARALVGPLVGARVLLLGAGGAARAVLCALLDARADSVLVLNRSTARAEELRAAFDASGRRVQVAADADILRREGFDLVVNATSLGLHETDADPVDLRRILRVGAVLDLVYAPGGTAWVRHARELGLTVSDGLEMLLHQGAAAFERWWRQPAPVDTMRAALAETRVEV